MDQINEQLEEAFQSEKQKESGLHASFESVKASSTYAKETTTEKAKPRSIGADRLGDEDKVSANYEEYLDLYKDQAKKQQIQLNGGEEAPERSNTQVLDDPDVFVAGRYEPIQHEEIVRVSGGTVFPNVKTNFLKTTSLAQSRQYPRSLAHKIAVDANLESQRVSLKDSHISQEFDLQPGKRAAASFARNI